MTKVKVRIVVAVDELQNWSAGGWNGAEDSTLESNAIDGLAGKNVIFHTIEAELEVPQSSTVIGTVVSSKK